MTLTLVNLFDRMLLMDSKIGSISSEVWVFFVYLFILGLANKKTVTIQVADKEQGVVLGTTKTKKQNKPKLSVNKSVLKKEFPRMAKAVANQV